jgi:cAMP-dependent protein kinase regulator
VKILVSMDPYERQKLGDALTEKKFKKGEFVIKEGEIGDVFYILCQGEAVATKTVSASEGPIEVFQYKTGDYFGERALLTNEARAANIIATVLSLLSNSISVG